MSPNATIGRRLVGVLAGASLVGALSVGTAGAVDVTVEKTCVTVPAATVEVKVSLTVRVNQNESITKFEQLLKTEGVVPVICVEAHAGADVTLETSPVDQLVTVDGTTVTVNAGVVAEASYDADAKVTVDGETVLEVVDGELVTPAPPPLPSL